MPLIVSGEECRSAESLHLADLLGYVGGDVLVFKYFAQASCELQSSRKLVNTPLGRLAVGEPLHTQCGEIGAESVGEGHKAPWIAVLGILSV
jgi:hypothetical protein